MGELITPPEEGGVGVGGVEMRDRSRGVGEEKMGKSFVFNNIYKNIIEEEEDTLPPTGRCFTPPLPVGGSVGGVINSNQAKS